MPLETTKFDVLDHRATIEEQIAYLPLTRAIPRSLLPRSAMSPGRVVSAGLPARPV
jgi:hypothetical protein